MLEFRHTDGQDFQRLLHGARAKKTDWLKIWVTQLSLEMTLLHQNHQALPYLYGNSCSWDDFFYPDGGSVRHRELAVGGLLRSSTDGHLPARLPAHVAEGPRGQSLHPILNEILIQQRGHCLANQQEPALAEEKHQACIWKLAEWMKQNAKYQLILNIKSCTLKAKKAALSLMRSNYIPCKLQADGIDSLSCFIVHLWWDGISLHHIHHQT